MDNQKKPYTDKHRLRLIFLYLSEVKSIDQTEIGEAIGKNRNYATNAINGRAISYDEKYIRILKSKYSKQLEGYNEEYAIRLYKLKNNPKEMFEENTRLIEQVKKLEKQIADKDKQISFLQTLTSKFLDSAQEELNPDK